MLGGARGTFATHRLHSWQKLIGKGLGFIFHQPPVTTMMTYNVVSCSSSVRTRYSYTLGASTQTCF